MACSLGGEVVYWRDAICDGYSYFFLLVLVLVRTNPNYY
jgi:hypothetical protein